MKELSIEEKAKRYDEAIEKLRSLHDDYDTVSTLIDIKEELANLFPELKESENERIRKDIVEAVELHKDFTQKRKEYIYAWLEKQGKQKKSTKEKLMALSDGKQHLGWIDDADKVIESEQKPADNVEPKFKVGDIVKHKDNPYLTYILKRFTDDGDYEFHAIGKDGNEGCTCFSVVKYQDEWELVEQKPAEEYNITGIGSKRAEGKLAEMIKELKPLDAILEKQDEQKPVNKPKFKIGDVIRRKDGDGLEWTVEDLHKDGYYTIVNSDRDDFIYLDDNWELVEQKSSWSEEDEINLEKAIWYVENPAPMVVKDSMLVEWLKSLKERYTWKPSDLQIECLSDAIKHYNSQGYTTPTLKELLDKLKKLKG